MVLFSGSPGDRAADSVGGAAAGGDVRGGRAGHSRRRLAPHAARLRRRLRRIGHLQGGWGPQSDC